MQFPDTKCLTYFFQKSITSVRKENISTISSPGVGLQTTGSNSVGTASRSVSISQAGGFIPSGELTQVPDQERAGNLNVWTSVGNNKLIQV